GEWLTKVDVGGPSEQPDGGDGLKAAFSDALKRAAVKYGVGRYLYRLPSQWVDYDPQRKQFKQTPRRPPAAGATARGRRPLLPAPGHIGPLPLDLQPESFPCACPNTSTCSVRKRSGPPMTISRHQTS